MITINAVIWTGLTIVLLIFGEDTTYGDIAFYGVMITANIWIAAFAIVNKLER